MSDPFRYFNSSPEVIRLVVMMYVKYPLSLRNVEDLLSERGIDISHETVRFWWNRFGPMFAAEIRKRRVAHMRGYPVRAEGRPLFEATDSLGSWYSRTRRRGVDWASTRLSSSSVRPFAGDAVLRIRGLAMDACDQTGRCGKYACEDAPLLSAHVAKRPSSAGGCRNSFKVRTRLSSVAVPIWREFTNG